MLGEDWDDHGRVFRALTLVDGHGVGGNKRVEFAEAVGHRAPIEAGRQFASLGIDIVDVADVAIVDFLVIVVLDLHDLVAWRERPTKTLDLAFTGGIKSRLYFDVE